MKENEGLKFEMEDNGKIPPFLFLSTKQGGNGRKASFGDGFSAENAPTKECLRKNEQIEETRSSRGKRMNFEARESGELI